MKNATAGEINLMADLLRPTLPWGKINYRSYEAITRIICLVLYGQLKPGKNYTVTEIVKSILAGEDSKGHPCGSPNDVRFAVQAGALRDGVRFFEVTGKNSTVCIRTVKGKDVEPIQRVRKLIHPNAARKVAEIVNLGAEAASEIRARLTELIKKQEKAQQTDLHQFYLVYFVYSDLMFHDFLLDVAAYTEDDRALSAARFLTLFLNSNAIALGVSFVSDMNRGHQKIVDAIMAGKPDEAHDAMEGHIIDSEKAISDHYYKSEGNTPVPEVSDTFLDHFA